MSEACVSEDQQPPVRRRGNFLQTVKAVAWAFFGVRNSREYRKDIGELNPLHVLLAGLIAALLLIGGLVLLVRWVLASGIAA